MKLLLTGIALMGLAMGPLSCATGPQFGQESDSAQAFRNCDEHFDRSNYDNATKCYESVRSRFAGTSVSSAAEIRLADIYFERKEYLLAAEAYRSFAKLHPAHPRLSYIYYRAGVSYLKESPKAIDRDQQYLADAIGFLQIGLRYFPGSSHEEETRQAFQEATRRLAARSLYVGKYYYKRKDFRASVPRFIEVTDKYRGLGLDEEAFYLLAQAFLKLDERKRAFETTANLKKHHPESKYLRRLLKDLDIE